MLTLQGLFAFVGIVFTFYVMSKLSHASRVPLDFPLALFLWRLTDAAGFVGLFIGWVPMLVLSTLMGPIFGFLPILALPVYFGLLLKRLIAFERE